MPAPAFEPAAELSARYYSAVVRPLLAGRPHAAALLGWGSDVLGYDTVRSTDHGWGPRLLVLLSDPGQVAPVRDLLADHLPAEFDGRPVRFGWDGAEPRHHVTVTTLPAWLEEFLGVDPAVGMSVLDWLLTPQQRLLGVVAGRVFTDRTGGLGHVRDLLAWYPDQVWRWLLACQWHRIAAEESFVARTAEVGDRTGSAVTAARLGRDLVRLALLLDRRYAPYEKWLGTAFARMPHPDGLPGYVAGAVGAGDPAEHKEALARAYLALASRQNATGLAPPVPAVIGPFHTRPAQVLMADRFTTALLGTVTDPVLRALPLVGAVDQVVDSTDVLTRPERYRRLVALYSPPA